MALVLITNRFDQQVYLRNKNHAQFQLQYYASLDEGKADWDKAEGLIIRSRTKINEQFLKHFPNLKFIVTATSGFDHIDLKATRGRDIKTCHVPQAPVDAVAELTFHHMLAGARLMKKALGKVEAGEWDRRGLTGSQLSGKTLGIIGLGRIGTRVAEKAKAFGLKVQAFDPFLEENPESMKMMGFEELLRTSDILSLHVPLTRKTKHMIKTDTLYSMSENAMLINTSRGGVINETDLYYHMKTNPEFIAALDVFEREPLPKNSELLNLSNLIVSPHIGASTEEALRRSSEEAILRVEEFFHGQSLMIACHQRPCGGRIDRLRFLSLSEL